MLASSVKSDWSIGDLNTALQLSLSTHAWPFILPLKTPLLIRLT